MDAFNEIKATLRIPVIQAPMFLASGPEMVIAACRSGIIGSFPTQNVRNDADLARWFAAIDAATGEKGACAPAAVNVIVHGSYPRRDNDLAAILQWQPRIVITALGSPRTVVDAIHGYGGIVLADVISVKLARKALDAGVDGLVLVGAGAGGHTGAVSGFALVEEIRGFFDGPLVLGGGIGSGRAIRAAEILGADLAYLGTRFLATEESMVSRAQKDMLVASGSGDIVCSDSFTGVKANWLRQSIVDFGLDPDNLPQGEIDFSRQDLSRWKDLWSAGQGVGSVDRVCPLAEVVDQLAAEYRSACSSP
ncbi:MAG: NAD(P)H-dependent flavin oxidoreductase [Gammaproteobacteria bacterium]